MKVRIDLNGRKISDFLLTKGAEYTPFNPQRARDIYAKISPHLKISPHIIHLVGTNGKGSTGRFIALGLLEQGKSVLHFTSPHLFSFNERFWKNGEIIDDEALEKAHSFLQKFDCQEASYFEYATFLALVLTQDVEYCILEAGLGGEFDSTSCMKRDVSVFTPIDFDHQEILGSSIEEIALTKLKSMASIAFIAPQRFEIVNELASSIAQNLNAKLSYIRDSPSDTTLAYAKKHHFPAFLTQNLHTALNVLNFLGIATDLANFKDLDLRGRCERFSHNITLDVGHNQAAARELLKVFNEKKIILVYNTYRQKDVYSIVNTLKPIIKKVAIIKVLDDRILETHLLEGVLKSLGIEFEHFETKEMKMQEEYLVFGSFSVIKQFLEEARAR